MLIEYSDVTSIQFDFSNRRFRGCELAHQDAHRVFDGLLHEEGVPLLAHPEVLGLSRHQQDLCLAAIDQQHSD